jgi:hypothetical protein
MPPVALVARFAPGIAERITAWQHIYGRAVEAVGAAEDIRPGGPDYVAALASTARSVRAALAAGCDRDGDVEVEQLAAFLRDEPAARLARAVVEVAKSDVLLDALLAEVAADTGVRERVDAAVEAWVASACRAVDSDAPGVVEQTQQANAAEWRPLVGLLVWLGSPRVGYRPRARANTDARVAEALAMHALRRGQTVLELPFRGGAVNGVGAPGGYEPSGRYDPDGRVLAEAPTRPLAVGPAPELPPIEPTTRTRWGWLA